jgi:hypothetical protein
MSFGGGYAANAAAAAAEAEEAIQGDIEAISLKDEDEDYEMSLASEIASMASSAAIFNGVLCFPHGQTGARARSNQA